MEEERHQSKDHRVSFHLWSQQRANKVRLNLPKFDLADHELPRCTYNGGYIDCGSNLPQLACAE